jgi:hypothetical protein
MIDVLSVAASSCFWIYLSNTIPYLPESSREGDLREWIYGEDRWWSSLCDD